MNLRQQVPKREMYGDSGSFPQPSGDIRHSQNAQETNIVDVRTLLPLRNACVPERQRPPDGAKYFRFSSELKIHAL